MCECEPEMVLPGREDDGCGKTGNKDEQSDGCRAILALLSKGESWGTLEYYI